GEYSDRRGGHGDGTVAGSGGRVCRPCGIDRFLDGGAPQRLCQSEAGILEISRSRPPTRWTSRRGESFVRPHSERQSNRPRTYMDGGRDRETKEATLARALS